MIISYGDERKHITLYPSFQSPSLLSWPNYQHEETILVLSINQAFNFREEEENEDLIDLFISELDIF